MAKFKIGKRFILYDARDATRLVGYSWYIAANGYVVSRKRFGPAPREIIYMHRLVLGARRGFVSDHKNRNKLDNRRSNLRHCSPGANVANTPKRLARYKYRGVIFAKDKKNYPWMAKINWRGKGYHLGYFKTEKEAALRYNLEAKRRYGKHTFFNPLPQAFIRAYRNKLFTKTDITKARNAKIRIALKNARYSQREIAERFGVSQSAISLIYLGKIK